VITRTAGRRQHLLRYGVSIRLGFGNHRDHRYCWLRDAHLFQSDSDLVIIWTAVRILHVV